MDMSCACGGQTWQQDFCGLGLTRLQAHSCCRVTCCTLTGTGVDWVLQSPRYGYVQSRYHQRPYVWVLAVNTYAHMYVHTVIPASLMSTHSSWSSPHQSPTTYKWIVAGGRGLGTARSPRPLQSTAYCVPAVLNLKQIHTRGHCAAVPAHSSSRRKRMKKAAVECVRIIRPICDPSACLRRPYSYCTRLPHQRWTMITQSQLLRDKRHCVLTASSSIH